MSNITHYQQTALVMPKSHRLLDTTSLKTCKNLNEICCLLTEILLTEVKFLIVSVRVLLPKVLDIGPWLCLQRTFMRSYQILMLSV